MRLVGMIALAAATAVAPGAALALQSTEAPLAARGGERVRFEDPAALPASAPETDRGFAPAATLDALGDARRGLAASRREAWFAGPGFTDRLRVTTARDLARRDRPPLPQTLAEREGEADFYDLTYTRGWTAARGRTESGLEVSLTPHAGFGIGSDGASAEAGATLRIGQNLDRLAPEGSEAFGDRPRWYLYAAGSRRAVGYNFARTRDGDFARSGVSHDEGAFLGDASIGVAYRRGAMQGSFGVAYREIETEGLRGYDGITTDVSEGLVAFQFSIKP